MLSGCSITHPVELSREDTFFRTAVSASGGVDCIPTDGDSDACLELAPQLDLARYAGDLGYALWEADRYRRHLAMRASERANVNSTYNALLWPLGAFVGARAVADPSAATLRDAAAVAVGSYGLLNSGIAGRDRLYMTASLQTACEIVWASANLFDKAAITEHASDPGRPSLSDVMTSLGLAIEAYEGERLKLLATIEAKSAASNSGSTNPIDRRYEEVTGKLKGGRTPVDAVRQWTQITGHHLTAARDKFHALDIMRQTLLDSGAQLRLKRSEIEARLNSALIAAAPELVRLDQVFAQVNALREQIANVTPSGTATGEGREKQDANVISADTIKRLTRDSQKRVRAFAQSQERELAVRMTHAERWLALYGQRKKNADALASRSHCRALLASEAPAPSSGNVNGLGSVSELSP
jgi:hypothetical protein